MSRLQETLKRKTDDQIKPQPSAVPKGTREHKKIRQITTAVTFIIAMALLALLGYNLITNSVAPFSQTSTSAPETKESSRSAEQPTTLRQKAEHTLQLQKNKIEQAKKAAFPPRLLPKNDAKKKTPSWPQINLTGLGTAPDGRFAIINGKIMREGQTIDGATIANILPQKVIMEYQGEPRSFTIGSN